MSKSESSTMLGYEDKLWQAADKLRINNGVDSALEKAESSSLNSMFPVTIASVQSLSQINRLNIIYFIRKA